jgi:chromosome segregation ATPase
MPYAEQLTNNLTYHRHIVSTMEKHFSDLLKKTDSVMLDLLKLQEENKKLKQEAEEFYDTKNSLEEYVEELEEQVAELSKSKELLGDEYKKNKIEIVKLKGDVGHYKNSALYYWSHGKLGDQDCLSYPENWDECLNATDEDNCDTQALTKKCMEAQQ